MSNAFSSYLADELTNWLAANSDFATAPTDLYVTLWNDQDNEVSTEFPNARLAVNNTDWTITDTGTGVNSRFENAVEIDFGQANADVDNIARFAVYDASTGGNLLLTSPIDDAPFDVSSGTRVKFDAGNVSFDAIEYGE